MKFLRMLSAAAAPPVIVLAFLVVSMWVLAGCGRSAETGQPPAEPLDLVADQPTFIFFYTDN